jgi:outer membrane protein assembly factor BamB
MPEAVLIAVFGELIGALAVIVWWLFFSRAPWAERFGVLALFVGAAVVTSRLVDVSIKTGMLGIMPYMYIIPLLCLALVVWAVASQHLSGGLRYAALVATTLLACGALTVLRTGGITGDADSDFHWRWSKTPEERLLASAVKETPIPVGAVAASPSPEAAANKPGGESAKPTPLAEGENPAKASIAAAAKSTASWPGFRGPDRDGVARGVHIKTDWNTSPPVELWREPVGPGWSSFAANGDLFYTQEQRGEYEVVTCYRVADGKQVWRHRDAARFWESNAGAGPRATPTLSNGRAYTFGATGILNALDAKNGAVVWSRNAAADTHTKVPGWGFSSSPLVVGDIVTVAAAGALAAYDLATGNPRWFGPDGHSGYSSPQLVTIGGIQQILFLSGAGATSFAPSDGKQLWQFPLPDGTRIVQPGLTADGDVLVHDGEGNSMRRLKVAHGAGGWTVQERWASSGLKPYFNDFVVHKEHAFGFDGGLLACIDLADGKRTWKGGRYGHGQLVLLADQDLLLVLSEEGELALVGATPDKFTEFAKLKAIEGKTWNHPALVGDILLVRNGQEMVAYRLSLA